MRTVLDFYDFEIKSFGADHSSCHYTVYMEYFGNYEGQAVDPALFLENNEEYNMGTHFYQPFDHGVWETWTSKSGSKVHNFLKAAARIKGHQLRPEVWGIVRCSLNIANAKWCNKEEYAEIQRSTKSQSVVNSPELVIKLLRQVPISLVISSCVW
ncbi:hypothetical protein BC938DRAFT_475987 [Jimgerdemannia flammicorona]|uniref:Uncharacterized protein n=1 Tax=Jimgerdemannia flammicorona TaxID=994334 RepID=A0A433QR44_9FUNG|nr:hypothetical protein BC938DRAFT_475987 [Jimgerdemannia flammicorona]